MKPIVSITLVSIVSTFLIGLKSQAQIIGPSVEEVKFQYTTQFSIPVEAKEASSAVSAAEFHAQHLFGLFHSPTLVAKYKLPKSTGGIGGPRTQMKITNLKSRIIGELLFVEYSNSGKMILHKKAAAKILSDGYFIVPMPANPYNIYDVKCTDEHYSSLSDYWYFYDVFKAGCKYLSKDPYATDVQINVKPAEYKKLELTPKIPLLRSDNGNGDLFSIYVIHGFEDDPKNKSDLGRINFNEFNQYLNDNGFIEDKQKARITSALHIYTKTIELENGKTIEVEIKHLLGDTTISSKSKKFAEFFKEAVESADVIVYGGHSGLGGNLDLPSLEEKTGPFKFNLDKKQIFFFDSCSSYSYYLEHFAVEKTKAKIDIISNGLSSYFHTSNSVLTTLMDHLLSEKTEDVPWFKILNDMENTLEGDTYLLNVGGI